MKAGIRVIRGPDWKWGDQDGGVGQIGTVIKPGFPVSHNTVVDGSLFVRWDSGRIGNYNIAEQHDLKVYSSVCAGIEHQASCDTCKDEIILGTRWRCSLCEKFNLCDNCYHGDQHALDHQFIRSDLPSSEGILVPARKGSVKLEVKGVFPGAMVVRNVEDWVLGQSDDGAQGTPGTVIIRGGDAKPLQTSATTCIQGTRRHGSVHVLWKTGNTVEHRRGCDGKVDVFCHDASDTVSGGTCYADHLAVLDSTMMLDNAEDGKSEEEMDNESSDGYDSSDDSRITSKFSHSGSLHELVARSGRTNLLHHTDRFSRGDRVRVMLDPDQFKLMQNEQYGGWCDAMALVFFVGDSVHILADEAAVRRLQIGHGGWVYRMKDILGKVGEIMQVNQRSTMIVRLDKMDWLLNIECGKLMGDSSSATGKIDLDSDSDDEGTTLSKLLLRTGGDTSGRSGIICVGDDLHMSSILSAGGDLTGIGMLSVSSMPGLLKPELLVQFAANNEIDRVKAIIAQHPDKIGIKNCGKTALHLSAIHGHIEVVKYLVEHGANILEPDDDGDTAVHYAVHADEADVLEVLLAKDDANANAVNNRPMSVLTLAVHKQAISCIRVLLRHNVNVNAQDGDGDTALHIAIYVSCLGAIDLIAAHPTFDFFITNKKGLTVLQLAVGKNELFAIKNIVRHAPQQSVDFQTKGGTTALHVACLNGLYDAAEVIVTEGKANMELVDDNHHTPLLTGLLHTHVSTVELLASHGANVNACNNNYDTGLHMVLKMIARNDARNHTVRDMFNAIQTSLIYSELPESLEDRQWVAVACCLVRYGADINLANCAGMTPIGLVANNVIRDALMAASRNRIACIPKT